MNTNISTVIVAPIISTKRNYPKRVKCMVQKKKNKTKNTFGFERNVCTVVWCKVLKY